VNGRVWLAQRYASMGKQLMRKAAFTQAIARRAESYTFWASPWLRLQMPLVSSVTEGFRSDAG